MAQHQNQQQIIRKDGKNCFVEVMKNGFSINRVVFRFITYDQSKAAGSKYTNDISIYLTFEQFLRIAYDILDSGRLIRQITKEKKYAEEQSKKQNKKIYPKQIILTMGGTSAEKLAARGKSRQDSKSESRVLKMFAGDKLPIMLQAELGAGETSNTGLIVPKYGISPDQKVLIGLTPDDAKELFLLTREEVRAYICARALFDMVNNDDGKSFGNSEYKNQTVYGAQYDNAAENEHVKNTKDKNTSGDFINEPEFNKNEFPTDDEFFGGTDNGFF